MPVIAYLENGSVTKDYTFPAGCVLPPGQYVILLEGSGTNTATRLYLGSAIAWSPARSGGAAALTNLAGGVDFMRWGNSIKAAPVGTNWSGVNPAVPAPGKTLSRTNQQDTDTGDDWVISNASIGSPNESGSVFLPVIVRNR